MKVAMFRCRRLMLLNVFAVSADAAVARPKVGLMLSGGGARGVAHIGVLKVLEHKLRRMERFLIIGDPPCDTKIEKLGFGLRIWQSKHA